MTRNEYCGDRARLVRYSDSQRRALAAALARGDVDMAREHRESLFIVADEIAWLDAYWTTEEEG